MRLPGCWGRAGSGVGLIVCSAPRSLHPLLCCLHLHAPPPERSGLSFVYLYASHSLDLLGTLTGNFPSLLFLVVFIYQKAVQNPNGSNIVKLDHPLSEQMYWSD